jgi:hypothetical protein
MKRPGFRGSSSPGLLPQGRRPITGQVMLNMSQVDQHDEVGDTLGSASTRSLLQLIHDL